MYISDYSGVRVKLRNIVIPTLLRCAERRVSPIRNPPCLLNPSVLVEVLSPSTQNVDKGEKFDEYKQIATVTDYVLVAQDRMFVTHYVRQSASHWTVTDYEQPTDVLTFATLDVSISLAEIYRKIVFPTSE